MITKLLANGILCFGPATFVTCAFILSQFAQKGCQFITLNDGDEMSDVSGGSVRDRVIASAGLHCWRSANGVNFVYNDSYYPFTSEHETAQRMALATTIMGATAWGAYIFASCVRFPPVVWVFLSLTLAATCVCQGLIFRLFNSDWCSGDDDNCALGSSSKCGISACVFWGISSLMTCGIAKEAIGRQDDDDDDVQE